MITPTLNLPPPATSSAKTTAATPPAAPAAAAAPKAPDAPSTTVTLSPQAMSAAYAQSHPSVASPAPSSSTPTPTPAPAPHDESVYESLKSGISTAVADVGDAIAGGAQAVVDGVETTLSTANKAAKGLLELPFAAVAKGCDAVGALIDEL
jgi:hypothetical protein